LKQRLWIWGPAVAQMVAIFAISSLHEAPLPEGMSDHAGHSIGYAVLGALVLRAFAGASWPGVTASRALAAIVLSTLYGMTDEWHQSFVPGRTPAWDDVAADFRGAVAGAAFVVILHIINKLWRKRIQTI
jgi:VanZ family protein